MQILAVPKINAPATSLLSALASNTYSRNLSAHDAISNISLSPKPRYIDRPNGRPAAVVAAAKTRYPAAFGLSAPGNKPLVGVSRGSETAA